MSAGGGYAAQGNAAFAIVTRTSLCESVIYARLDVALWLPANGGELRNNQIVGALKHSLFAE